MFAEDSVEASLAMKAASSEPVKTPEPQPSYDEDGEYSPHSFLVLYTAN